MKTERKELSLSQQESDLIQARADDMGLSFSAFVVLCCCNARITIEVGSYPVTQNLNMLAGLYERGLLTSDEFARCKKDIMDGDSRGLMSMQRRMKNER